MKNLITAVLIIGIGVVIYGHYTEVRKKQKTATVKK